MLDAQEPIEHLSQGAHMVQVIQDDDTGQIGGTVLTLLGDVSQVLTQLLARLVVHVEGRNGAWGHLFARPVGRKYIYFLDIILASED
jgi:hypothetical protein